jgi:DNA-directed RNA polymerase subunit K/omega
MDSKITETENIEETNEENNEEEYEEEEEEEDEGDEEDDDLNDIIEKDTKNENNDQNCLYQSTNLLSDEEEIIYVSEEDNNNEQQVDDEDRISEPIMTKYEIARILGFRTKQISLGSKKFLKDVDHLEIPEIARLEIKHKMVPLKIKRPLPNNKYEIWKVSELEIPKFKI